MTYNTDIAQTLPTAAQAAAAMLRALGNEHRLGVLCALAERPMTVGDINRRVRIAQSALSQHLARLRAQGVVTAQRRGVQTVYSISDARARRLVAAVCAEYRLAGPAAAVHRQDQAERGEAVALPR